MPNNLTHIVALSRKEVSRRLSKEDMKNTLLIDTYNGAPMNMLPFQLFNPFYTWPSKILSVPGMTGIRSRSIEAIWQGTKLINHETDYNQFESSPYKRPSEIDRENNREFSYINTQFTYKKSILNHIEARFLIYLIAYLDLLNNHIPDTLIKMILSAIKENKTIIFYDWDTNMDISNVKESFSHSAILASWFRQSLKDDFFTLAQKNLSQEHYKIFSEQFIQLTTRYQIIRENSR